MDSREEHLQWCKNRALEYVTRGELQFAFSSFKSDMSKHEETKKHSALEIFTLMFLNGHLETPEAMRKFIEGFN